MKNAPLAALSAFFKKNILLSVTMVFGLSAVGQVQIVPDYPRLPDGWTASPYPAVRFQLTNMAAATWNLSVDQSGHRLSLTTQPGGTAAELTGLTNATDNVYKVTISANIPGQPAAITKTYDWVVQLGSATPCPAVREYALVLDLSGSMGIDVSPGYQRFALLQDAVKAYIPTLKGIAPAGTRFRVYYFNGSGVREKFTNSSTTLDDAGWGQPNVIQTRLFDLETPSGMTPLGAGVGAGVRNFSSTSNARTVVLFTDGIQNVSPMVVQAAVHNYESIEAAGANPAIDLWAGTNEKIKILTIGVGATGEQAVLMEKLANPDTWFEHAEAMTIDELSAFFTNTIPLSLRDCSPRIVDLRNSTLNGFDQWTSDTFAISRFVDKLTFRTTVFSNDSDDVLSDDFELWKDGQQLSKQFVKTFFENKSLRFEVELPIPTGPTTFLDESGKWVVRVRGTKGAEYESLCLAEDKYLETDLVINGPNSRYAGDEIPVEAKLQFAGRGIDNAVVRAILLKPGEDLGDLAARRNVAAKNLTIAEPPASNSTAANSQALGQAKLDFLLSQPDFIQKLEKEKRIISLVSTGGGTYRGNFPGGDQTQNTGTYRIVALFDGTADGPKTFESWESRCVYLDFSAPDDIKLVPSLVYVGKCGDGKPQKPCYQMAFTPVNKFGKRLGPAQAPRIQVKVGKPTPIDLIDNLDGSYSTVVFEKPDGDPTVSIFVGDHSKPVFESPISRLQKHFGVSAHVGMTIPRSELDTMFNNSGYAELDFTYRFGKNRAWQASAVGGFYAFEKDFNIVGARAQIAHLFNRSDLPGVQFRLGAGAGYYVPKNEDGIIGYNLDAGAVWHFSPVADLSLDARYFVLDKKGYQFATLGVGAVFFF